MKARILISCLFVASCLLAAVPAAADIPLPPVWPSTWVNVVDEGIAVGNFFNESYVATSNEEGMITDLFVVGDSYSVFVNGVDVLDTPVVPDWTAVCPPGDSHNAACWTDDPNVAWGWDIFSKGTFALAAGDIVTIREDTLPSGFSDGTYAITATTPEPGCIALLSMGVLGLIGMRRRK